MNRPGIVAYAFWLAIMACFGQRANGSQPVAEISQSAEAGDANVFHGVFPVVLSKSIDSKKVKPGDGVEGKTAATVRTVTGLLIPKGSKLVGHITQSTARAKGDTESSLAIVFDKIELAGGKEVPLKGVVQAVGDNSGSGPSTGAAGAGTMASGVPGAGTTPGPGASVGPLGNDTSKAKSQSSVNEHSTGVFGIKNLQLDSNSLLTSPGKEVKLDTEMVLLIRAE